jgi:hypothetical protein
MKRGMRWHSVSTNGQLDGERLLLSQCDQPVENRLPVLVAREVVVGDEETLHALRGVVPHDRLHVVGASSARDAALHVDDGAEAALERATASGIERGHASGGAGDAVGGQKGDRHAGEVRQCGHVVVERLQRAGGGVAQQRLEPVFRLSGIEDDAKVDGFLQIRGDGRQHGERAGDMESADDNVDA